MQEPLTPNPPRASFARLARARAGRGEQTEVSSRDRPLDPMNFTYRVAIGDPRVMRDQVRVGANIEAHTRRPACHRIQAYIGNGVVLAQQILMRRQMLVDKGEARPQPLAEDILLARPVPCRTTGQGLPCASRWRESSARLAVSPARWFRAVERAFRLDRGPRCTGRSRLPREVRCRHQAPKLVRSPVGLWLCSSHHPPSSCWLHQPLPRQSRDHSRARRHGASAISCPARSIVSCHRLPAPAGQLKPRRPACLAECAQANYFRSSLEQRT